jgi:hypothetical protein
MELVIGRGEWARDRGAFPAWRQHNCLVEETKTDPKGYNLLSRPPLAIYNTVGAGPVQGLYTKPGLFGGAVFAVSGGIVYRDGVSLGAIHGTGPVWWAGGIGELCLGRGQSAYSYNGTNLAPIVMPAGFEVRHGHNMARRFVFVRKGSGRFYWSDVDDGRTIDGLNFANAENEPDDLLEIHKKGDTFLLMGQGSVETWLLTGDNDLPWSPVSQQTDTTRGLFDNGCAQEIEGGIFYISNDRQVCAWNGASGAAISDGALWEKIAETASPRTYTFQLEGRPLFAMRLTAGTYLLDLANQNQPALFSTFGRDQWAPMCAVMISGSALLGDDTGPSMWKFDENSLTDSGSTQMERLFTAGTPISGAQQVIANVIVSGNSGAAPIALEPVMEMRASRNGGRTWGTWKATRWGAQGEYGRKARYGARQ